MPDSKMLRRDQAAKARSWLAGLSLPPNATEAHIQRLFGFCAALVLDDVSPAIARFQLQELVAKLPKFVWFRYTGDPIFALAVHRILAQWNIPHASLEDYYYGCKNLPVPKASGSNLRNRLFFDLSDKECAHSTMISVPIPLIESLVRDGRSALLETCRTIMVTTSCGTRQFELVGGSPSVLPKLCCSYATDWDLAATCILVRTCAYLGLSDMLSCESAISWLLDQQCSSGQFGLVLPEDCQDRNGTKNNFLQTTDVLWTLAEIHRPGFMLMQPAAA